MVATSLVLVERDGPICTLTLNRPERRNAVDAAILVELRDQLVALRDDLDLRVVILRGAGDKAFSAGYDLTTVAEGWNREIEEGHVQRVCTSMVEFPRPIVAMIGGYAIGAGCELALASDIRVAADTARLRLPVARMGLVYSLEGMQRLLQLVGTGASKYLLYSARMIEAPEAARLGLVDLVVPEVDLVAATRKLAEEIAANAPFSLQVMKTVLNKLAGTWAVAPAEEDELRRLIDLTFESEDAREAIAAFFEKRPASFRGR